MFKIYLKGGAVLNIDVKDEDSKLTAKEMFAKLRTEKKRWYDCKNNITFIIDEVSAISKNEEVKIINKIEKTNKKENNTKK